MSKKEKKELVTTEVTPLGSEKSTLAKSSTFESKISKADMTNIIKQNILEQLNKELVSAKKDREDIRRQHDSYIKESIRPKMLTAYSKYITDTYKFEPNIDNISIETILNGSNIRIKAEYKAVSNNLGRDILNIVKGAEVYRYNYSDEPKLHISLPSICFDDAYIEKNLTKQQEALNIVNDIELKILKYTDSSYLKAQLDMSIIASTGKGEEVVSNIQKLANSIVKQTGLIALN